MIVTVTLNPAIDKTVYLEELIPGMTYRSNRVEVDFGGKGINVAKVLIELGSECLAIGIMPKEGSEMMFESLKQTGVSYKFCMIEGRIRTNTKVIEETGRLTEINEQGCEVSKGELEEFYDMLADTDKTMVVLSGSVPKGVPKICYAHIIEMVKSQGGRILLDASGEVLYHAIEKRPNILKINESEFESLVQNDLEYKDLTEELICRKLIDKGIEEIIITRGEKGISYYSKEKQVNLPSVNVPVSSAVGAGDTLGAAYLYAKEQNMDVEEALKYAIAAAAASVETMGTKTPAKIRIEEIYRGIIDSTKYN